jgi:hypothetical protein
VLHWSKYQQTTGREPDPVAGDTQKPGLFKFPVGSLALPGGKGRRIAAEIGNKLNVVTKMTEHMLQLVRARASDLPPWPVRSAIPTVRPHSGVRPASGAVAPVSPPGDGDRLSIAPAPVALRRVTLQMSLCGFLRTRQTDRKLSLITDQERGARLGLPVGALRFVAM